MKFWKLKISQFLAFFLEISNFGPLRLVFGSLTFLQKYYSDLQDSKLVNITAIAWKMQLQEVSKDWPFLPILAVPDHFLGLWYSCMLMKIHKPWMLNSWFLFCIGGIKRNFQNSSTLDPPPQPLKKIDKVSNFDLLSSAIEINEVKVKCKISC